MATATFKSVLIKTGKITGITLGSILAIMFLLPILFPGSVEKKIKEWTNQSINGELNFSKARLSFFSHFPSLTLSLYNFTLKGSAPFEKDTLIATDELALGINLRSLFSDKIAIDEIYLTNGDINVKVDAQGHPNYNVYKSDTTKVAKVSTDSSTASLKIERIQFDHTDLRYDDQSIPVQVVAKNLNYLGKGDLTKSIFDLASKIKIDSFDLTYNHSHYIGSKKLKANLITKVNTNSLAFIFEKNEIELNKLPMQFNGSFGFLKDGYEMDFNVNTVDASLYEVLGALPASYMPWFDKMDAKGNTEIKFVLKGKYEAVNNKKPDLSLSMKIRDGYLDYEKAPDALQHLYLDFDTRMPQLNTDSLKVNIDSLSFDIDKSFWKSNFHLSGLNKPAIKAHVNAVLDLAKIDQTLGIKGLNMKGKYTMNLVADGNYFTAVVPNGLRKTDTVIASIPVFNFTSSLTDGYFKLFQLPKAIDHLGFNLNAGCTDGNYKHTIIDLKDLDVKVLDNYIKGFIKLKGATAFGVDADLKALFKLKDIKDFYPLDSTIKLDGNIIADIQSKGVLDMAKKVYPVLNANINLKDGLVKTKYYSSPIEQIQVSANIVSKTSSPKDVTISVLPISLLFEGQPFTVKADIKNLQNIKYDISSAGTIDIGKIYSVFALKGYDLKGLIKADLSLKGLQSDATGGHYDRLFNSGTLSVKDLTLASDLFPKPFEIKDGNFHFDQDKMMFDKFHANYGSSDFQLNGYLNNVINYALKENAPLQGQFDLKSKHLSIDEFMAFATTDTGKTAVASNAKPATKGVVIIPQNLAVNFNAFIDKATYNGLNIDSIKGQMSVSNGVLKMTKSGFNIVGAPVLMDATYQSKSPNQALFNYHINAQNFNIKKAYDQITMLQQMMTSAKNVQGIVSLDYNLSGKLDENMMPIMPSLKGGGTLSLADVRLKGFRLMNEVSKATDRDSLTNPNLKKVDIKSTIKNNIITIERTKMKIFGLRPRFEGQVSLDGRLNLKGRVGLPPLGIFGIPFSVTGTQTKPIVKLKRGSEADNLQETVEE